MRRQTMLLLLWACPALAQTVASPTRFAPVSDEALHHITQFYEYDAGLPLEARIIERLESTAFVREKIVFRSSHHGTVPGYLAIPKQVAGRFPFVILIHGIGGSKDAWWSDDSFVHGRLLTTRLLDAGIGVLTLDAALHGERIAENHFEGPETVAFRHGWPSRMRDMMVQSTVECRRAVDYLTTRKEVDTERIGVLGFSMGGMMVFPLMAVDERIRVGVACVAPVGSAALFNSTPLPAAQADRLAAVLPYNFARQITNRPLRLLAGRRDAIYSILDVRELVDMLPTTHKDVILYDSGHRLPREYVDDAAEWLIRYLLPAD